MTEFPTTWTITLCMGSSCFARGNGRNLEQIERHMAEQGLEAHIELSGTRCEGRCAEGPVIALNGTLYTGVTPEVLPDILGEHLITHAEPNA